MDKDKLYYFKKRLLEEKKRLLKVLNNMNNMKEFGSMDVYYSELSNYDNHPADIGTELFMMEQDNGFKNSMKDTLNEIDNSLEDIKDGSYGICKACKKKINEERLDLIPYLKNCMECADSITITPDREMDTRKFVPIDEEQGTSFSDTTEDTVEFDREDAYQKLASFNIVPDDPSFATGDDFGIMDEQDGDGGDGVEEVENISQEYYDETLK
ncbi:transcriptional regulator, TraR/DksA family [Tissierella praeacuta DSM 18095]|uniref:Transcriptional regulator, TraR/DksA family n=1 Tax=Tissierella praeacuta DSM 18095 TaxID=1123404 RepID=A0A1M4S9W9_9FIRM|nr:TraR/DksA C4-type zinc finger protein [Tissierella praeacuta]TCU71750.1 TraR/DksA family transcriptional regulator [Tissierella praeacuta]SHE29000.1 transcriptional regulator, TraR/DksA family [Tissierella praeacuta DSM 18095]SUP01179.1 General stress protein 16O [Tissierella praeacuta]